MLKDFIKTIIFSVIALALIGVVHAWTEPTATPPNGNVPIPLNTSGAAQIKSGGLWLNSGGAATGLIVEKGNVGIGTINPTQKLEIGGIAGVDGIKFPDGSIQKTALGANSYFVTGSYIGSGVNDREIVVGFQPDYVMVGTTDTYEPIHRNKYMPPNTSQAVASGGYLVDAIKSFTANGFTIGTRDVVNIVGRTYWYNAFKGGTPPSAAAPVINSFAISPSPIGIGQSTTISWNSSGASYCIASGSGWSGNKVASGSEAITPTAAGILTYTVTCYNDVGQNVSSSTTVDVRNWVGVSPPAGNYGESCNAWLTRTGQAGVNGSAPKAWDHGGTNDILGSCIYGTNDGAVAAIYNLTTGGSGTPTYYGPLSSNVSDPGIQPIQWHCCGDMAGTQSTTYTRR